MIRECIEKTAHVTEPNWLKVERLKESGKDSGKRRNDPEDRTSGNNSSKGKWNRPNKKNKSEENLPEREESKFKDKSLLLDKKYKFGSVFAPKYKEGLVFPKFDDDEKMCFILIGRGWCRVGCYCEACHQRSTMTPGEKARWIEFKDKVLENYKKENPE